MFDEISFDNTNDNLDIDTILNENSDAGLVKQKDELSPATELCAIAVTVVGTVLAYKAVKFLAYKAAGAAIALYEKKVDKKEQEEDNE